MTKEQRQLAKKEATKELHEWLYSLWVKLPVGIKKCNSCGGPIFGDFKPLYFDHALEKEKYPQYRMTEANINLICGDCHWNKTSGFMTPKYKEQVEKILNLHLKQELK